MSCENPKERLENQRRKKRSHSSSATQALWSSVWGSEDWFYNLTELIPNVSIQGYKLDGTVVFWNKASESIYGYTRQEALGQNLADLIVPDPLKPLFYQCLEIGKTLTQSGEFMPSGELLLLHKQGHQVPVYSIHTAVCKPGHETILFCMDVDLSQQKKNEQEQIQLNKNLKDKNKHLQNIIHIATHDLRTPMLNIQGFSEELKKSLHQIQSVLKDHSLSLEEQRETIERLYQEDVLESLRIIGLGVDTLDFLIRGLLRLAKQGITEASLEPIDMDQLLAEIQREFTYVIRQKEILLEIEALPSCYADRLQIYCVFSNLVKNAIDHLKPDYRGHIRIWGAQDQDKIIYCVEDNGIGIAQENIEQIFNVFYRVNPTQGDGEGLGLTIVRQIIDRHDGRIWVESEWGHGSRFYISLPSAHQSAK